ncbi:MAG TPA: inositol-3-phosphate synthase, partial [Thermoanaerobaculia bacterium]
MKQPQTVLPADGKLGILLPGLGAVATTMIAGVLLARKGLGTPIGSLTQMGTIRLGKRTEGNSPAIRDFLPLAKLDDIVFGAWDIFPDNAYESAVHADVLTQKHLDPIKDELEAIKPMPGVFYPEYVRKLHGTHVKQGANKAEMVAQLREDIRTFKCDNGCTRAVAVWCGSTEVWVSANGVHHTPETFEAALENNDPAISNAQMYAWACIKEQVPFANGAPNLAVDFPAAWELARREGVPIAGKDFKTGQTLMKTVLAPMLKARMLGVRGWFSTNILGNRDGEVLDDPESFKSKETTKLGVLDTILQPHLYKELYG